ncbi:histone deacetylase 8 [Halyomorpha halys]|uniref:histone deacetylase 8 n=1 Tax=Halyomorpha halys TaxID=286706 RepID=UPI0006D5118A|nr:histone deacetylase 8-like [Halyomorpha halys]
MEIDKHDENTKKRKRDLDILEDTYFTVGLVFDEVLFKESLKHPRICDRSFIVHNLIKAYDLLRNFTLLKSTAATKDELCTFHSSDYIEYLEKINQSYTPEDEVELEYGIGYDCPPLDGIYDFCCAIAGGTLTAARALCNKTVDIAINWCGGWHHAQRDEAEGFCYINDVALGILELRKTFQNVLYFDLDIHHGNGVENCFSYTKRVMTVSFHLYEPGFYPGTGLESEIGDGNGRYYSVNVPLKNGASDEKYKDMFDWVLLTVLNKFKPDAIVVQCGADGLSGDPIGENFNLSLDAYSHCVKKVLKLQKPTLFLGGGGYHIPNTARCWTYLSSVIVGVPISNDIPEHDNFTKFGPTFELQISKSNRKDNNSKEYLSCLKSRISANLNNIGS